MARFFDIGPIWDPCTHTERRNLFQQDKMTIEFIKPEGLYLNRNHLMYESDYVKLLKQYRLSIILNKYLNRCHNKSLIMSLATRDMNIHQIKFHYERGIMSAAIFDVNIRLCYINDNEIRSFDFISFKYDEEKLFHESFKKQIRKMGKWENDKKADRYICTFDPKFGPYSFKILHLEGVEELLSSIKDVYAAARLQDLGVDNIPTEYAGYLSNPYIFENFEKDMIFMLKHIEFVDANFLQRVNSIVFEGAQGLLLDQEHEYFPHVTRSNTGMKNVVDLIQDANLQNETIEITYATRAYLTRHGAGPLPGELPIKPYPKIEDKTNVPNPYQETLRYAYLDLDLLIKSIQNDLSHAKNIRHDVSLSISCLDQVDGNITYIYDGKLISSNLTTLVDMMKSELELKNIYIAYGPSRKDITTV